MRIANPPILGLSSLGGNGSQRRLRRLPLLIVSFAVLAAVASLPARATTPVSFTLTGGPLSISAPLSDTDGSPLGTTISDQRGGDTTWTASAVATTSGSDCSADDSGYATGSVTTSANVVATAAPAQALPANSAVIIGQSSGPSSASWSLTNHGGSSCLTTLTYSVA